MSVSIRFTFGPCDPLNPEFGYEFRAESKKGVEMFTGTNPDTGRPLTIHDCIALAQTFAGPDMNASETYAFAGDDYATGKDAGLEAAAQLVEQNAVDHGSPGKIKRLIPGVRPCVTRSSYADAIRKLK